MTPAISRGFDAKIGRALVKAMSFASLAVAATCGLAVSGDLATAQMILWKDATGRENLIPIPKNYSECMRNGPILGYDHDRTKAHCDLMAQRKGWTVGGALANTWKDVNGNPVRVKRPRTHAQCMINNKVLKYPEAVAKAHCDKHFPQG
jgi:hypothetical protein